MAKLVIVPTPIGNLEDITLRAIRMFKEAELIYAEDTRVTKKLLNYFEIAEKTVFAFHAHNEHKSLEKAIETIKNKELVVLASDAGTPGISDPGFLLARACIEAEILVECLPGPTAFVPALVASGFPCDRFVFEGFLPHKKGRQTKWQSFLTEERTIVLYESPHRLIKALDECVRILGEDRQVCVVRELSKFFEEYKRGKALDVLKYYQSTPPKGEIVLLIAGNETPKEKNTEKKSKKYRDAE